MRLKEESSVVVKAVRGALSLKMSGRWGKCQGINGHLKFMDFHRDIQCSKQYVKKIDSGYDLTSDVGRDPETAEWSEPKRRCLSCWCW